MASLSGSMFIGRNIVRPKKGKARAVSPTAETLEPSFEPSLKLPQTTPERLSGLISTNHSFQLLGENKTTLGVNPVCDASAILETFSGRTKAISHHFDAMVETIVFLVLVPRNRIIAGLLNCGVKCLSQPSTVARPTTQQAQNTFLAVSGNTHAS